ncbi:hypothetical protein PF003_g12459 [Phytophthora fragariae]|nr:hypothetical protein PF003_g12459 [Phytophthora fragariae]
MNQELAVDPAISSPFPCPHVRDSLHFIFVFVKISDPTVFGEKGFFEDKGFI